MPRLIELQQVSECRGPLAINVGDVLMLYGSGGQVQRGSSIELGGPYLPATAVNSGEILTAMGAANTLLAWARSSGPAEMEIVGVDSFGEAQVTILHVNVED